MILWRSYYDDGKTYSNLDGSWMKSPQHGVICVVVLDPTGAKGRWVNSGYNKPFPNTFRGTKEPLLPMELFVCYPDSDEPFCTNHLGPFNEKLANYYGTFDNTPYVKYGRETDQHNWEAIMNAAVDDPDFPRDSIKRRKSDFK